MDFLIEEDLPRSLVGDLKQAGLAAGHVIDLGMRGRSDDDVLALARSRNLVLVTGDVGFGNLLRYPPKTHAGIVVARLPNDLPTVTTNAMIVAVLLGLTSEE